ncbi:MAG: 30S ribosomal protein S20 [Planctomycetes bacterium]|nr:30S ribosomal protein S20 [Planctomycetota bacterium]
MPHSKQAKKRLRQNEKLKMVNKSRKSSMRTMVKKVLKAVEAGDAETAAKELPQAMKKIDKAAKHNVIHKNQASRKIGRLNKKVHDLTSKKTTEEA